jgi:hypothetical protein
MASRTLNSGPATATPDRSLTDHPTVETRNEAERAAAGAENRGIDRIDLRGVNKEIFTMLEWARMQIRASEWQINSYFLTKCAMFFSCVRDFCTAKCLRRKDFGLAAKLLVTVA